MHFRSSSGTHCVKIIDKMLGRLCAASEKRFPNVLFTESCLLPYKHAGPRCMYLPACTYVHRHADGEPSLRLQASMSGNLVLLHTQARHSTCRSLSLAPCMHAAVVCVDVHMFLDVVWAVSILFALQLITWDGQLEANRIVCSFMHCSATTYGCFAVCAPAVPIWSTKYISGPLFVF